MPTELAQNIVQQLIEFGETRRGWLGVRVQPVTDDVAASLGMDSAKGALNFRRCEGWSGRERPNPGGDVVLKFDGKDINEMRDLLRIVAESPVGKEVDVVVYRDGKEETVKVKLGQLQDTTDEKASAEDQQSEDGDGGTLPLKTTMAQTIRRRTRRPKCARHRRPSWHESRGAQQ